MKSKIAKRILSVEEDVIQSYRRKREELKVAEEIMDIHFNNVVDTLLPLAKTIEDFIQIKERLRVMPESASKVLLFRKIILTENEKL